MAISLRRVTQRLADVRLDGIICPAVEFYKYIAGDIISR
jgi:hypothetical protein